MKQKIILKTSEQIEILRVGGKILASILEEVSKKAVPGISTYELDMYARTLIAEYGAEAAFLGYKPAGVPVAYPAALCTSLNDEIVHGIPKKERILKEGDTIALDLGLKYKGLFTDHAITVPVGTIDEKYKKLLSTTKESLLVAIHAIEKNSRVGDIGFAVQSYIKPSGYGIIRELAGHGVGVHVHEDPYVQNFGKKGTGESLVPGMVIAIEPMITLGKPTIIFHADHYTISTKDKSRSAHFEHTIAITENGAEILTSL